MNTSFPLSIHTAYAELVRSHSVRRIADLPGKPFLRDLGERGQYWYMSWRVGSKTHQKYVGPDSPEVRAQMHAAATSREEDTKFERRTSSLVAQLRAAGVPSLDRDSGKVLRALANTGVFRLGGTLVGTHAFRLYSAELGVRADEARGVTADIDIAAFENLKLVIEDEVDPGLVETFAQLDLHPAVGLDPKRRPTRWTMNNGGAEVEFLVPRMQSRRSVIKLEPLGVFAQALPFLNYLIAQPIHAVALYRAGVLVQIPRPERFAVHKLIVASRRRRNSSRKATKDLAQARQLFEILAEDRPAELADAYAAARANGPKWRSAIDESLQRTPAIRVIADAL